MENRTEEAAADGCGGEEETMGEKQAPSIFNDVLGPIMRGPSSSHVAGAARIGELARQAAGGEVAEALVEFDVNGSLAESHEGHGTDMGLACGLMGMPLTDPRVMDYRALLKERGIRVEYRILDYGASHPNHYRMTLKTRAGETVRMEAISTGGGMIRVLSLDGFPVFVEGDSFESFYTVPAGEAEEAGKRLREAALAAGEVLAIERSDAGEETLWQLKTAAPLNEEVRERLRRQAGAGKCYYLTPVLPVGSGRESRVPFRTATELLEYNRDRGLQLWELAVLYESRRGNLSQEEVYSRMRDLVALMRESVRIGLEKTQYDDRILPAQAWKIGQAADQGRLVPGLVMNEVIRCVTAIMEAKSSMNVIVAAPTAGSCGCLPGTLIGLERALKMPEKETVKGMLAAGLIGVFFAEEATFAAEVGGCQMECGAGSGMAAAGVAQMMGATAAECLSAASFALQSITGLACDPVANRVEVPCLNKNIMGGMNALGSANVALAGFDALIGLDEVIGAIYEIGLSLPLELRCTLGGLGKTRTSMEIRRTLEET